MKAITFKDQTMVLAENQKEFENLPVHVNQKTSVLTACFEFEGEELKHFAENGKVKIIRTTGRDGEITPVLQPVKVSTRKPELEASAVFDQKPSSVTRDDIIAEIDQAAQPAKVGEVENAVPPPPRKIELAEHTEYFDFPEIERKGKIASLWVSVATFGSGFQPIRVEIV